jgi:hypothetical protein
MPVTTEHSGATAIRPFRIDVPDEALAELNALPQFKTEIDGENILDPRARVPEEDQDLRRCPRWRATSTGLTWAVTCRLGSARAVRDRDPRRAPVTA